ncbi:hypothetical protein [Comamonas sp. NoAH]|uniref:hypothetical protein n=1 Tax=Comamonas halotolerans TaxID=3041496 RepID=UPI0024E13AAF|nr:hypothetical protein [Comamonas sp. NoAH]
MFERLPLIRHGPRTKSKNRKRCELAWRMTLTPQIVRRNIPSTPNSGKFHLPNKKRLIHNNKSAFLKIIATKLQNKSN